MSRDIHPTDSDVNVGCYDQGIKKYLGHPSKIFSNGVPVGDADLNT